MYGMDHTRPLTPAQAGHIMAYSHFRIIKQAALIFSWICMGLFSEVSSPTLPYLKKRVDSNYEEISRALVARSVGFLLGSLGAGLVGSKWRRLNDFWIFLALFVAGGATIVAPWCPNLALLSVMFLLDGAAKGLLAVVTSTSVMMLWKEKAAVPTHSLHFSFGIGALLAPQIARPFLPKGQHGTENEDSGNGNQTLNYSEPYSNGSTPVLNLYSNRTDDTTKIDSTDRIEIVYAIMGGITLLAALIFLYFQLTSKEPKEDDGIVIKKRTEGEESACKKFTSAFKNIKCPVVVLCGILFIFWCLPTGAERAYGKFLFAYAVEGDSKLAPSTAASLESVFWACFTAGRGLATIVSKWAPPPMLLAGEITVKVICAFLLAFLSNTNKTVLFVVTGLFGATVSPIFPATMVWANMYIEMTAVMNAFAFLSAAFGAFIFSWGAGYFFQYWGPQFLMYLMLGYAWACVVVYVVLFFYLRFGKLNKRDAMELPEPDQELDKLGEKATVKL